MKMFATWLFLTLAPLGFVLLCFASALVLVIVIATWPSRFAQRKPEGPKQ